jgi:sulfite reductase alpha subunit-like flavoprotein
MATCTIKLPPGLRFSTGFTLEILPNNEDSKVSAVLEALKFPPDDVFTVTVANTAIEHYIPTKVSVQQLFKQYIDLGRHPTHALLRAFLTSANDEGSTIIGDVLDRASEADFEHFVQGRDTGAMLVQLAQYGVPALDTLLSSLPHIVPERFAISCTSNDQNTHPEFLVQDGTFCAEFLAREGTKKVPIRIGMMSVVVSRDAPVILAISGVGFSAVKPVLEGRDPDCGMGLAVFECQNTQIHAPIIEFLEDCKERELLNDVFVVPQDEGKPLIDRLRENGPKLWEYWENPQSQLFCAGKDESLVDAFRTVLLEIAMGEGHMPKSQAEMFCQGHPCVAYML